MAMTEAINESIWLQGLLDDLGFDQDRLINSDNMSVIYLVKNQVYHAWTKHINIKLHFVREILEECDLVLEKIHRRRI